MKTKSCVYLDTSAYLGVLLKDPSAKFFLKSIKGHILCSSYLLLIESERNLVRMNRQGLLNAKQYQALMAQVHQDKEVFILRALTEDLCLNGEFPPVRLPRSGDLVHLRTARWFALEYDLKAFLTLDQSQREAAVDFGLSVF